jgi:hypothetical protein
VAVDGFIAVFRARGLIPAGGRAASGECTLIGPNKPEKRVHHSTAPARRSRDSTAAASSRYRDLTELERAFRTMSHPPDTGSDRTISRRRRLILLRTTAPPSALLTAKPNRVSDLLVRIARSTRNSFRKGLPCRYTAANSLLVFKRWARLMPTGANRALETKGLDAELVATLLTSRLQHLPTAGGTHAGPETMRPLTRDPFRLVSALRHALLLRL